MKTHSLSDQVIVIIGASGGLGGAIARQLSQAGARLVLAGRNQTAIQTLAGSLFGENLAAHVDLTSPESLDALCRKTMEHYGRVDAVIDAGGMDIRKPFLQHTPEEMDHIVRLDLLGPMLVTRTFLPVMIKQGSGQIVLVGGFGNGRLSFPYFTADVAARAGLATFVETINRELTLEGIPVTVTFFSPEPAHTEAESPYFDLWQDININIASAEKVAEEMVITLMKQEQVHIMGGWSTKLFGIINDLFPRFFGKIFLSLYGEKIKNYLGKEAHEPG